MRPQTLSERLRPGRDANDTSWVIRRYAEDWAAAARAGAAWNPARGGLELAALARPELAQDWLATATVTTPDGTAWRAGTETDRLLRRGVCDPDFAPVDWVGGTGRATGRFDTPTGVTADARGRLYVADSGNGRVQVLDPAAEAVVAVLSDGLVRPVQAHPAPCGRIYIADPAQGAIVVYSARFAFMAILPLRTLDPETGALWTAPPAARPLAVATLADGTLVAFDPARPQLWHMSAKGAALPAHPWPETPPPGWMPAPRRFSGVGEVVLGPIDGGAHDLPWHRVLIEAEMPEGTSLTVQTFATNDAGDTAPAWAPRAPVPVPSAIADRPRAAYDRLVLSGRDGWELARLGRLTRARPVVARLDGTGPVNLPTVTLPVDAAARIMPGDRIALVTRGGGRLEARVTAIPARTVLAAAEGAAFHGMPRLLSRGGAALPYGDLALDFLPIGGPLPLVPAVADGRPERVALPHAIAAFLQPGDVVGFAAGDGRIEIVEIPATGTVTLQLDTIVQGDFSTAEVHLLDTAHRLVVREPLPDTGVRAPGSMIRVLADVAIETRGLAHVDGPNGTLWLTGPLAGAVSAANWTNAIAPEARAGDRGRYLWVRLRLQGAPADPPGALGPPRRASATPLLRTLRVTGPRPSLLNWLPKVFASRDPRIEPPGAIFLERFLALFEGQLTRMEEALDSVSRLLNPDAADGEWIAFIAAWQDFVFDPSWPLERRRKLVIEGARIQSAQGTPAGLIRYLEIYTGGPVAVTEAFRARPAAPIQLGTRGALGVAPIGGVQGGPDRLAHRFRVTATLPGRADQRTEISAIRRIIETMKPAHTAYTLDTGRGPGIAARIGMDTAVDAIVIPGPVRPDPCACDPDAPPSARPQPGRVPGGFRLGGRLGRGPVSEMRTNGG